MQISQITSGRRKRARRILLYGVDGIGKSTWASQAGKAVFIKTEDGVDDIECDSFPLCRNYADARAAIYELYQAKHDFETVALDTADWLEKLIHADVAAKNNAQHIDDIPYGKGFHYALAHWREVIDGFEHLRLDRGMAIIVLAHAQVTKFANPATDTYDRYGPQLHKDAAAMLMQWADEVLFANYEVITRKIDAGFNRKEVKTVDSAERVLYTSERPAHHAKNRLGLPATIPFAWQEFAKYLQPAPA